jgi:FkbM family methyltransferase
MNTNSIRTLMAKALPYRIRKVIPLRIAQHLYFNGVFQARLKGKKIVKLMHAGHQIENEIYWRGFEGCHEKKSMDIFACIIQHLGPLVVWDIGANSGTYGLLAKALNSDCEVVFFEPIPKAVEMIKTNLRLNGFEEKVFEIAVGDFNGEGEIFFEQGHDFATSVTVNKNTVSDGLESEVMKIEVRRLDSLITEQSLKIPELVKLDVETYEYEVLKGWGRKFPMSAIFLIEILRDDLAIRLTEFFPADRYDFWNIDDRNKSMSKIAKLGKSDFYNILIIPASKSKAFKNLPGFA